MIKARLRFTLCLLLAAVVLTAFAALAGGAGSREDPLVTLSYLSDTFTKQVLDEVDKALDTRDAAIRQEVDQRAAQVEQAIRETVGEETGGEAGTASVYAAVTLSGGQVLQGSAGCEVILRGGSAVCAAAGGSTLGLVDTTTGGALSSGSALEANHLYLMTDRQSVSASGTVTLLVRGSYTVG